MKISLENKHTTIDQRNKMFKILENNEVISKSSFIINNWVLLKECNKRFN